MPDWKVRVTGAKPVAVCRDNIFETAAPPSGPGESRFHFTPPYVGVGWVLSLIGLAGLLWQAVLLLRGQWRATNEL